MFDRDPIFEAFVETFTNEIESLWSEIRTRKRQLWERYGFYLERQSNFQEFRRAYKDFFQAQQGRRTRLLERRERLKARLLLTPDEIAALPSLDRVGEPDSAESLPPDPIRGHGADKDDMGERGDDEGWGDFVPPPSVDSPSPADAAGGEDSQSGQLRPKKVVSDIFRWMYHGKPGLEAQARRLIEMVRKPDADGVEIFLRMPFDQTDEALWATPRADRSGTEALYERYFRFRLWADLLPEAERRAAETAAKMEGDQLFGPYRRYLQEQHTSQNPIPVQRYLEQIEKDVQAEIDRLQEEIDTLEAGGSR